MDVSTMCDPLPSYPCCAFHLGGLCPLPPVGGKNTSYTCLRDRRTRSHCTIERLPDTPVLPCSAFDEYRSDLHFRRRLVGRSSAVTCCRGFRDSDWQRFHDLRSQNESHILSRLRLQPLRPVPLTSNGDVRAVCNIYLRGLSDHKACTRLCRAYLSA